MDRVDLKLGFHCNNRCRFCVQGDKRTRFEPRTPKRIAADLIEAESRILFKREMLMGSYVPGFVSCETGLGAVEALTFVANHAAPHIRTDIPHADKVRYIATGTGRLGSSREYLENLADQFEALDIDDPEVFGLLKDVRAFSGTAD